MGVFLDSSLQDFLFCVWNEMNQKWINEIGSFVLNGVIVEKWMILVLTPQFPRVTNMNILLTTLADHQE